MKQCEISLTYFRSGDDLAGFLDSHLNTSDALRAHAEMLDGDANTLRQIADAISNEKVKISANAHFIFLAGPDELIDRLMTLELVTISDEEDEDDEDVEDEGDDEEDDEEAEEPNIIASPDPRYFRRILSIVEEDPTDEDRRMAITVELCGDEGAHGAFHTRSDLVAVSQQHSGQRPITLVLDCKLLQLISQRAATALAVTKKAFGEVPETGKPQADTPEGS